MRRTSRTVALSLVTLAALAACATPSSDADAGADGGGLQPGAVTDLTIVLDETGEGDGVTTTLTCDPVGGDHPDAAAACEVLASDDAVAAFTPVPADTACTEIYGGAQVATVTGTLAGEPVDASFSRVNGCEIARWDTLATVLGSTGGA